MSDDNVRDELNEVFEPLDPPPGGLAMLRGRLEHDQRRMRWWMLAAPVAVAAVLFLVIGLGRSTPPVYVIQQAPTAATAPVAAATEAGVEQPGLVSLGLRTATGSGVFTPDALASTQVLREVSRSDEVLVYYVATLGADSFGSQETGQGTHVEPEVE